MAEYYMAEGSAQRGPFKVEDLAKQGVRADTLVWAEGMANWLRADQVPEVKAALGGSSPAAAAASGGVAAYDAPAAYPTAQQAPAAYAQQPQYPQYAQPQQYAQQPYGQYPAAQYPAYPQTYHPGAGAPPAGASNSKIAAGLCGILLGWLGIHKFILGMNGAGLIMLLVSVVGGVITCGVATSAMSIIGLIEGIIYLTKSDEEFYQLYVVQKKEWF